MAAATQDYIAELEGVITKSPYGPFDNTPVTIADRFPGEHGRRLQDLVWHAYVLEVTEANLFSPNGAKTFVRHQLNSRNEVDTRRHYMGLITKHGMLKDIRGSPWAIRETVSQSHSNTTEHRLHLISSATLIEAIYLAVETAPENLQVIQTKKQPIQNITIFNPKTPTDVLHYVRDLANMLNGVGSNISFVERLQMVPAIETKWAEERKRTGVKFRDSNFNAQLGIFLDKFWPSKWDSARDYTAAVSIVKHLTDSSIRDEFLEFLGWNSFVLESHAQAFGDKYCSSK